MNGAQAWRAPLFWIATGAFIGVVGAPLLVLGVEAAVALVLALRGTEAAMSIVWTLMLGVPLAFFVLLFADAPSRVRWALRWADRRVFRVALLVASAVVVAFFRVTLHVDFGEKSSAALSAVSDAGFVLAIAGPVAIGALLLGLRAGATREGDGVQASPILWLAVGCFASVVSFELGTFAWNAALSIGGRAGLGSRGIQCLVWIVTIATPPLCLACAFGSLGRRSPSPRAVLRGRIFTTALAGFAAAAIAGWLFVDPIHDGARALLALGIYDAAIEARTLASIVAGCMMPLAVGALMLRLRDEVSAEPQAV